MSNCFLFSMKLKFIYIYPARACGGWYTMAGYGIEWKTSDTHAKKWHKTCFKDVAKYLLTVPSTMYMNECAWTKRSTILALFYVQSGLLDISLLSCTLRAKYMAISSPKCVFHFWCLRFCQFFFTKIFDAFDSPEQCVTHNTNAQNFNKSRSKLWCWPTLLASINLQFCHENLASSVTFLKFK